MVSATLIDNNLAFVARKYIGFRQKLVPTHNKEDKYGNGISVPRYYTKAGVHPYDEIVWENRTASIKNEKGDIIFEQKNVEMPSTWSQTATNIVVSKYFTGKIGEPGRESSARQLIDRVAKTMSNWGRRDGYFQTVEDGNTFEAELTHILINQMAAFNSPVWFNVGVVETPQCSACFINSVHDDMRSIMNLATTESMLFKYGSGTGSNLSKLRASCEYLSRTNGKSSGVVSFMKGWDSFAGIVKSGGRTRRAAKMVMLDIDHPDIVEFIECKVKEEKKAWALVAAGYDGSFTGEAYTSIFFQNANNSVRVTDEFMRSVENDGDFSTTERTTGNIADTYKARDLMHKMAESAWWCGDPGIQYDTTINKWHTSSNTDRINGSNPCSEYMFLDDTACNLSSLNLMNFRKGADNNEFDVESYKHALEIMITAMDISVGNSSYPTPSIEQNSYDYRPLGIGYANLGALLMSRGLAYDSDEGRNLAAALTSMLTGVACAQSAKIASKKGAFAGFDANREPCMNVMRMHREAAYKAVEAGVPADLQSAHRKSWDDVVELGTKHGLRNAQISVLAPTGTISFLMDCATTGVEPDIALVKYKWMVDGGMEKLVNSTVPEALRFIGYSEAESKAIESYITEHDTIEGAPGFKDEHLPIFDCAFKAANGTRTIHYMGHVRMMAAVQPFLSGAISKTVNMPEDATIEDIEKVYMEGWKLGLKAIAIYRDGSKRQQPLTTSLDQKDKGASADVEEIAEVAIPDEVKAAVTAPVNAPRRRRLPDERRSITHKFSIAGHKGYLTVGLYDDGTPGEIFIMMNKEGSVMSGLVNSLAATTSIALQYGVPLEALVNKFAHMRFEPSGFTNNPNIKIAKSIVDYIFRYMAYKFLDTNAQRALGVNLEVVDSLEKVEEETRQSAPVVESQTKMFTETAPKVAAASQASVHTSTFDNQSDAPACGTCGSIMVRNAACYKCLNCGATSGCS
ncbi:vitamin B12-dependent ribonucleotide reductase [Candidatus Uhrbacteria bacterium]|nr:vitamin B12-dependent ribonucleotide reductase [Candidatus Uhrbacteria bacterium]